MIVREIEDDDAEAFLVLCRRLDAETAFMLLEPGERMTTADEQRASLQKLLARDNQMVFVAEHDGQLVGYLGAYGGAYRRNHDTVHIVVGILQTFTGQGLGVRLFTECERWARRRGLHRLELTVMTHNAAGIALYKKMGFQIEGTLGECLKVDGRYVDQYSMSKVLA